MDFAHLLFKLYNVQYTGSYMHVVHSSYTWSLHCMWYALVCTWHALWYLMLQAKHREWETARFGLPSSGSTKWCARDEARRSAAQRGTTANLSRLGKGKGAAVHLPVPAVPCHAASRSTMLPGGWTR